MPVLLRFSICLILGLLATPAPTAVAQGTEQGRRIVLDAPDEMDGTRRERFVKLVERVLARVEKAVQHRVERPVFVRYRRTVDELPEHDRHPFHDWTVAFARPERGELVLVEERVKPDPPDDLESVLAHELTHVVLGDLQRKISKHVRRVPRWYHEGLAQVVAGSRYLGGDDQLIWFRARTGRLLSFSSLSESFPADVELLRLAYAQSASYFAFLDRRVGRTKVLDALRSWLTGEPKNLDVALADIDEDWSFTWAEGEWARDLENSGLFSFFRDTCFNVLMLLAVPLLAIVLYKRFQREERAGERLEQWEHAEEASRVSWVELRRSRRAPDDSFEIDFDDHGPFDDPDPFDDDVSPHDERG